MSKLNTIKLIDELSTLSTLSKAEQLRPIEPIESWVDSPYYLGEICYGLYPKYKQHLKSIFDEDRDEEDYIDEIIMKASIGCLVGYTKIKTHEYSEISILDIVNTIHNTDYHVYSRDSTGIHKCKILSAHRTKYTKELVDVHLSNNEVIRCTPEHLFQLNDLTYVEAQKLRPEHNLSMVFGDIKVKCISRIFLDREIAVYDLTIDKIPNFSLSNGIFIHNSGKTSFCNVVFLRKLYELSCYSDIRPLYNLMSSKKILMVYFSITREVAEQTGYAQLRDMLLNIPYFQEYFFPNTKKSYDIDFPTYNMAVTSGSKPQQVLGGDVIASVIDEGDFYGDTGTGSPDSQALSKAQYLYAQILKRARSRFLVGGRNYSLNMIISSPTYESSFISKLIQQRRSNPHTYIIEETLWTVKPKGTYSDENFIVFKGTPMLDPCIVENVDFYNTLLSTLYLPQEDFTKDDLLSAYLKLNEEQKQLFILIPIDFKKDFETDLITALQDIASIAVAPLGKLFTSEKHYARAIRENVYPFVQEEITISTSVTDERLIQNYFAPGYKPEKPELPRFVHFDLSTTGDEAGVASSYAEILDRTDDGAITKKVTCEWMMRVVPPKKPEEIDLKKMRSILYYMRDTLNLRIGLVTFDSYASEEAIQSLKQDGFDVKLKSVDRDDKAYLDIMQLYYQGLLKHPDHKRYKDELFGLVHYRAKRKVDHTAGSDKGITDALVGSAHSALIEQDIYAQLRTEDISTTLALLSDSTPKEDILNLDKYL